jgi:thymidylate synthase
MDEVQLAVFASVFSFGKRTAPRGISTIECIPLAFTLSDPRKRCILNPARRWSLPLAIGELAWHLSGSDKASSLAYYSSAWNSFADPNGRIVGSCYGAKIFSANMTQSQWNRAKELLTIDPDTRRAILYFSDCDRNLDGSDVACATSLQFLLREGRLEAVVSMRSNDAVWGLPYDVFLFSFLQEKMATELGVALGSYHHVAASMHIYERHIDLCQRVLDHSDTSSDLAMPVMDSPDSTAFLIAEEGIRNSFDTDQFIELTPFWNSLARVLAIFRDFKRHEEPSAEQTRNLPAVYQIALSPMVTKLVGHV